jgi:hypothetical protein
MLLSIDAGKDDNTSRYEIWITNCYNMRCSWDWCYIEQKEQDRISFVRWRCLRDLYSEVLDARQGHQLLAIQLDQGRQLSSEAISSV